MPKPKPLSAHVADGTTVPCRHANRLDAEYAGEPNVTVLHESIGDDDAARYMLDLLLTSLPARILARADEPTIEMTCCAYSEWKSLMRVLKTHAHGTKLYGEVQKQVERAWAMFDGHAKRFGMTPADRSRIKLSATGKSEEDPFEKMVSDRTLRIAP